MTQPSTTGRICRGCGQPTERLASHCDACMLADPATQLNLATCVGCGEPFMTTYPASLLDKLGVYCLPCSDDPEPETAA